jgi:cytochrome P450
MMEIDIFSEQFNQDPYRYYKQMRDEAPIFFSTPADCYVLSRYDDIAYCLKHPAFTAKNYEFQSEPLHGRTFLQMDGNEHSKYRNIVAPAMRGHELAQQIVPIIQRVAAELYAEMKTKPEVDFATDFAARFPILVMAGILGLDKEDEPHFLSWYRTFVLFIADLGRTPEITAAAFQVKAELEAYMLPIIAKKRENPGKDLISTMCISEIDGVRMSDQEIKAFVSLLITTGGETTDKMSSLMLRNLLEKPEQLQAVINDRSLLDKAIAETLRYTPVTQRIMRMTSEAVEVAGTTIPANAKVMFMLGSAQRDERKFQNPDEFDIYRTDLDYDKAFTATANHLAFGAGRHFCVGAMLGKAELEIAFNQLFDFAQDIEPAFDTPPAETGIFTRGIEHLPIRYSVLPVRMNEAVAATAV